MQKTCVKCGHVNPRASVADSEACPSCGVIYAKALATGVRPVRRAAPQSGFGAPSGYVASRNQAGADEMDNLDVARRADFVIRMRAQSLYPTVRTLVKVGHWVAMVLAAFVMIAGLVGARGAGAFAILVAAGAAAVIVIVSFAVRELSLMLADLSDAAVRMAAKADQAAP